MASRIQRLRTELSKQNLDGMFVSSLPNITYFADKAGQQLQERGDAFLLITQTKKYLFTYKMYADAVKNYLGDFTLVEIVKESPLANSLKKIVLQEKLRQVGFDAQNVTVAEFTTFTKEVGEKIFTQTNIPSLLRLHKSPDEIAKIQTACSLGDMIFKQLLPQIHAGITERQVTNEIDYAIGKQNASASFTTVTAFGANAAYPHHVASAKKLTKGDAILLDFGIKKEGYCSDMSRTIFWHDASTKSKKVYQTVYDAQQKSIEYIQRQLAKQETIHPGTVDQVARDYLIKQGLPQFNHASHGIGLECHELPYFSPTSPIMLEENMVFSIEPGCYLPGELGVRIEDLFTIQKGELLQLTHSSKNLIAL